MLLTGGTQQEGLGHFSRAWSGCVEISPESTVADTERDCDGGSGARGKGLTEENTQGRKDKRQSTNQLNTQASLDGFVTTKPGEEEEGGTTMLVKMTNGERSRG